MTTTAPMTSPPISPVNGPTSAGMAFPAANAPQSVPVELDGSPVERRPSASSSDERSSKERAKAHAAKEGDPAVLVDIPKTPAAQDYEVAEHQVTGSGDQRNEKGRLDDLTADDTAQKR